MIMLRSIMLDQLLIATFRRHGLQVLMQLYEMLSGTVFSRFVSGAISYAMEGSLL